MSDNHHAMNSGSVDSVGIEKPIVPLRRWVFHRLRIVTVCAIAWAAIWYFPPITHRKVPGETKTDLQQCIEGYSDEAIAKCDDILESPFSNVDAADVSDGLKADRLMALKARASHNETRDKRRAISDYSEIIRLDPKNANAFYRRGMLWSQEDNDTFALRDLDQAIALSPNDIEFIEERARIRERLGDDDRAIEDLSTVIGLAPQDAAKYVARGRKLALIKRNTEAEADLSRAIQIEPERADLYLARSAFRQSIGQTMKAIEDLDEAIRRQPTGENFYERGDLYFSDRQCEKAIYDYEQALKLWTSTSHYMLSLIRHLTDCYMQANHAEKAANVFDRALMLRRDDTDIFVLKSNFLLRNGDTDGAIKEIDRAIKLQPNSRHLYSTRAEIYLAKRDITRAIEDFGRAIELGVKNRSDPDGFFFDQLSQIELANLYEERASALLLLSRIDEANTDLRAISNLPLASTGYFKARIDALRARIEKSPKK